MVFSSLAMQLVTIVCRITWFEQTQWIADNCVDYKDVTNWAAWTIGIDDINFYLKDRDATIFWLKWG